MAIDAKKSVEAKVRAIDQNQYAARAYDLGL
jgi:hypothetical protein